jgi:protein transport protein SEC31
VQHILATTSSSGVTVVWDLKVKRPVIYFNDKTVPGERLHGACRVMLMTSACMAARCRAMAWHPDMPTQIVTGAESDEKPVIQFWDLRNTYAPVRYLEKHTRAIAALSWSSIDPVRSD